MKSALIKHLAAQPDLKAVRRVLPQILTLIEASRQHVVSTANLTLVWLYWNVGRVITDDIQQHSGRADYGEQLLQSLAHFVRGLFRGFILSIANHIRVKRFFIGIIHARKIFDFPGAGFLIKAFDVARFAGFRGRFDVNLHKIPDEAPIGITGVAERRNKRGQNDHSVTGQKLADKPDTLDIGVAVFA